MKTHEWLAQAVSCVYVDKGEKLRAGCFGFGLGFVLALLLVFLIGGGA